GGWWTAGATLTWAMSRGRGSLTFQSPMMRAAGPADMITTRSDSAIASSRSWVTNSTALRSAFHRSSSRLPMICRVCASSGPNGSSLRKIFGSRMYLDQADALPLAAGEHVRTARAELGEADAPKPGPRPLARKRACDAGGLEPDRDVLQRRLPWEQRLGLEEIAGLAVEPGERRAEDVDATGR